MSVYVDSYFAQFGRMQMSHMIADTLTELHEMADKIGVARRWFQSQASFPHYDVCKSKRELAIKLGAIPLEKRPYVMKMREIRALPAPPQPSPEQEKKMMQRFRKKPVVIEAMLWSGGDMEPLHQFCGRNWGRADAVGSETWPSDIADKEQVVVFNTVEQTWLPVPVGWWIVRGIRGELYPCAADIFTATYEPLEAGASAQTEREPK